MRQEQGLDKLVQNVHAKLTPDKLAELLLVDLHNCQLLIFGNLASESPILLASLDLVPGTLYYETFCQRIEFSVAGKIISNQTPPLTYQLQGHTFSFHGRCSTIPKVCGVDFYLNASYTEIKGDHVHQRMTISIAKLWKNKRQWSGE